jgi:hypothetical protein
LQIKAKIVSSRTADSKPVRQEVNDTVIVASLVLNNNRKKFITSFEGIQNLGWTRQDHKYVYCWINILCIEMYSTLYCIIRVIRLGPLGILMNNGIDTVLVMIVINCSFGK